MAEVPPRNDQDLNAFAANFDAKITLTPTAYGLLAADATAFHALALDFATRLATALNPTTRNKGTVAAKNTSKAALLLKARSLLKIVSAYPPLTAQQRADLGMNPRDVTPTPAPVPSTKPLVTIDPAGRLRLTDETTPTRRAKPVGVMGALVFMKIAAPADPPPVAPNQTEFALLATKTSATLEIPAGSNGKMLYVLAQWVNDRGESGPVSTIAATSIAA